MTINELIDDLIQAVADDAFAQCQGFPHDPEPIHAAKNDLLTAILGTQKPDPVIDEVNDGL